MPDSKFDLGDYVEVKDRLRILYELFGTARVTTSYELTSEPDAKPKVICRALVYRTPDDPVPSTGTSWMYLPGLTSYTKFSEIENCETSAVGRAIGMMGILIDRSIATATEIRAKASEDAPQPGGPVQGGLVGTAEIGKAPSDFELRIGPGGSAISFRLVDGRQSIKVVCLSPLADALYAMRAEIIGKRVTCWGKVAEESFVKDGKTINFRALTLERIMTTDFTLPAESVPMFSEAEQAALAL